MTDATLENEIANNCHPPAIHARARGQSIERKIGDCDHGKLVC